MLQPFLLEAAVGALFPFLRNRQPNLEGLNISETLLPLPPITFA